MSGDSGSEENMTSLMSGVIGSILFGASSFRSETVEPLAFNPPGNNQSSTEFVSVEA